VDIRDLKRKGLISTNEQGRKSFDIQLERGINVAITMKVMRYAARLNTLVLVTGEGDFAELVEYLTNMGKTVFLVGFSGDGIS
jgi:uncharacterized LabA/DUF88 family protein